MKRKRQEEEEEDRKKKKKEEAKPSFEIWHEPSAPAAAPAATQEEVERSAQGQAGKKAQPGSWAFYSGQDYGEVVNHQASFFGLFCFLLGR
jgi:hypothetical protein